MFTSCCSPFRSEQDFHHRSRRLVERRSRQCFAERTRRASGEYILHSRHSECSRAAAHRSDLNKIFIIDPADLLNAEAANALLKGLEEPPESTFFILVTVNVHELLLTVQI